MKPEDYKNLINKSLPNIYNGKNLDLVISKINSTSSAIKPLIDSFLLTGNLPNMEVAGYTVGKLMESHSMNPLAAMLTMDWLTKDPEKARLSLSRGHDSVVS